MIPIIQQAEHGTTIYYRLFFCYVGENGWGYGFDCDEHGIVDESKLNPTALKSLHGCRTGSVNGRAVSAGQITKEIRNWKTPKIGRCICGQEVCLDGFTNTCEDCNRDYNWNGSLLASREQWGEETNETAADILMGGDPFDE